MGGNAALLVVDDAGFVEKGFFGAAEDMGGNAALLDVDDILLSSFFVKAPNGDGAALDMGGKALEDDVGLVVEKGFFGAAVDIGGNAALLEVVFFS